MKSRPIAGQDMIVKNIHQHARISPTLLRYPRPTTTKSRMGFDKPDLGFVVHLGAPSSPIAYYQQVGRAGRAASSAEVILLPGAEDRNLLRLRPELVIAFWDERMSSMAINRFLIDEADINRARRAEVVDKMAAGWILQGALERLRGLGS